jgi:heme A synthase
MLGRVTVGLLFLLLVWGNLVAGLKAGLACPDWPLCHGKVLPPFRWDIYMEFGHRVIAAVASVCLIALAARRYRKYEGSAGPRDRAPPRGDRDGRCRGAP